MPYKDLQRKKEWEQQHRPQRLARRRELRRIEAARKEAQPAALRVEDSGTAFLWLPLVAGGALASYNPQLAMGAGGLTLVVAALYKKSWSWWIVGILLLTMGFLFLRSDQNPKK